MGFVDTRINKICRWCKRIIGTGQIPSPLNIDRSKVPYDSTRRICAALNNTPLFDHVAREMNLPDNQFFIDDEKRSQLSFIASDTLPTEIKKAERKILEKFGVRFGEVVPSDHAFQFAELPNGWKKVPGANRYESYLVDEKERARAFIHFDGAVHNRGAYLALEKMFSIHLGDNHQWNVLAGSKKMYSAKDKHDDAEKWLNKNYPMWKDPSAYWDIEIG
jgi:hypothetical protein